MPVASALRMFEGGGPKTVVYPRLILDAADVAVPITVSIEFF